MFCIGLTGNIASGKSLAMSFFKSLGINVISADQVAREITVPDSLALKQIQSRFGDTVILHSGELNRAALKKIIFNDQSQKQWLENLLHPMIRKEIEQKVQTCTSPYCVVEIPILLNRKDYPYLNRVLLTIADKNTLLNRVIERDNCSKQEASAILDVQLNEAALRKLADDIIINEGSIEDLEKSVKDLHKKYLEYSQLSK